MKSNIFIKSNKILIALILVFSLAVPSIYAAGDNSAAAGGKSIAAGGKWGTKVKEALDALHIEGDPEDGEEVYDICAACHQPTGWGDPSGTFPQLAGQHTTVLIKQIADIRAGNRDNPTMYPFAIQIEGAQDIADVAAYIQTLKMNPNPRIGPGGPSFILSNLRKAVAHYSLDELQGKVGDVNFKKLKTLEEKEFKSKKAFLEAVKGAIGAAELEKYQSLILEYADWSSDLKLGTKLFTENCVKCHQDHGQGSYKDYYPVIAQQTYLYLLRQFHWIKIGKRRNANPDMVKQIKGFSFLDMKSVVDTASRFKMREGDWKKIKIDEDEKSQDEKWD